MPGRWQTDSEVGPGFLARGAALVYRYLVLEVLLIITMAPTAVMLVLLEQDASNLPLYALALVPVGPAVVAGLGATAGWEREADLSPARPFWRAYRREVWPTLAWWVPTLAVAAVLGINLVNLAVVPGAALLRPLLIGLLAVLAAWACAMAVLQARFAFRLGDAARVAGAAMVARFAFPLGVWLLLAALIAVVAVSSDAVGLLLAWAFVALLHLLARPFVSFVTERFTHD